MNNLIYSSADLDLLISSNLFKTTVHGFVNDLDETPDKTTDLGANNNGMLHNYFYVAT